MITKFLDPKNDVAFKKIFGTEKNKDILIHFLNDVLTFKGNRPIQDVTFLKTIQDPETAAKKTSIVDILCKDAEGACYIVEMQIAKTRGFEKRAQYYASKAYCSQASVGDEYHNLKEIIFLAIADYVMFPKKKGYKSEHVILDKETYECDLKDFSFTFIELPKFTKKIEELAHIQDKWCYFFKHAEDTSAEDLARVIGEDEIIEKAYSQLNRFSWTEEEFLTYEQSEKQRKDYLSSLAQKFDEGEAKGRAEGRAEGKVEGEAKGRAEGKAEGEAKGRAEGRAEGEAKAVKEMALNLFTQGVSVSVIQSATKLSKEEIEWLTKGK